MQKPNFKDLKIISSIQNISSHLYKKWYLKYNELPDIELLIKMDLLSDYESNRTFSQNLVGILSIFSTGILSFFIGVITILFSLIITQLNIASDQLDKSKINFSKIINLSESLFSMSWQSILMPIFKIFAILIVFGVAILVYFYSSSSNKKIKYHICKRILQQRALFNNKIYFEIHSKLANNDQKLLMTKTIANKPDFNILMKLAKFFVASTDYLLGLTGSKSTQKITANTALKPDEQLLLNIYRRLDEQSKGKIQERAKILLEDSIILGKTDHKAHA